MLKGRLGLDEARIPQADRHGVLWLRHGRLYAEDGTIRFATTGTEDLPSGDYAIPAQALSAVLLEPGTTVSHDALRLLAAYEAALVCIGEDGVRYYASLPRGPDRSARARRHAALWADSEGKRLDVARRMYAWRLGEILPSRDIDVLRGIEGARMRATYALLSKQYGVTWRSRSYDRSRPDDADPANQAINHAGSAVYALASVAVAVTGAIPQLGFIHEDSGHAFALDIADLYRDSVTLPIAFRAVRAQRENPQDTLERQVRRLAGRVFRQHGTIGKMIQKIKDLFDDDDDRRGDS